MRYSGPRRSLAALAAMAMVGALTALVTSAVTAPAALAIPGQGSPFDCSGGTIYQVQRGSGTNGILNAVSVGSMSGTNPVSAAQVSTSIPNNQPNALGITAGGLGAWALAPQAPTVSGANLTFQLYSYNTSTQAWTNHPAVVNTAGKLPSGVTAASIASGGIVAGAIDPLSGNYYWASLANAPTNAVTIFGWNTTSNTSIGVVANSTWPETNPGTTSGTNGDIAFDRDGDVFIVSSVTTNAALGLIKGPLPTTPQTTPPTLTDTRLTTYANPNSNAYNGIAFDNTGSLFLQFSTTPGNGTAIVKVDPNTGTVLAGPSAVNFAGTGGTIGVDLAACSVPPVMQLQKNVVNRQADTDQFNLSITGGGLSGGNTATTSGTATGVQAAKAGPVVGVTGTTYTFAETAAGTTVLANYTTTYQCIDQGAGGAVVASGTAQSFNFTLPAPGPTETGQSIVCTFTNSAPRLVATKASSPVSTTPVAEGQVVTYTLTFDNSGGGQPATVNYTDNLSKVLDDATVTTPPALATGSGLTVSPISGGTFTVTGTLAARATATVTFAVRVNTPDTGDHQLDNFLVLTGTTPPATCLPSNPACTTNPVPALVVSKSVVPASTTPVAEGQILTYTLTFSNAAGKAPATVNHTDDLTKVLDDATVTTPPALATGTGLVVSSISGGKFTITGAVPAGTTATVTFAVRVNTPDTGDHQLDNFLVPTGTTPPATCLPSNPTCTTNPVPALVVTKTAVPASTTSVNEGDTVTYTLTFSNAAGKAPATVNHTDNLTKVLDDATVTTPPATSSGLTIGPITGGTFTVTGTLAAGATASVTFAVKVNTPDTGDHRLDNFLVPTGTTPPATCLPSNLTCTTHPVPALVVTKTAVPASTTAVSEGQVITYTLTFSNAAGQAPATVNHTDDLTKVLDDATVTTPPTLATGTGLVVSPISGGTFTVTGTLAPGATATVTLAVTVNTPDTGNHRLDNFVVPTGTTPPATCLPSDPTCTTHPVPALLVTKTAVPASTTAVSEGQVITYTLTFSNALGQAPATVNHTDDLSKVLDDATVTTPPALATGTGLIIGPITGGTFTVTGTLAAGATATVTFAVTVNAPDTGNHLLDNFVVPTGTTPPATCLPSNLTCTTHPVPALFVTKTAVPASTTPVNEGQVITYTLTFSDAAGQAPATVNHTDDLSKVLDDATVTTPPALATGTGLIIGPITGGTFTVTGTLAAGATATVTFAVTVNTPDTGDHQLDNFVVPTGTTPPATCLPADVACTTHPVPALVVTKTAVPASTTPVNEGQVVTYTLTFDNAAGKAPATVNHTDDLSKVLDDATVTTPPALATGTGLIVGPITGGTFTVTGAVRPGTTATVTFAVTVNTPDTGNHQLDNFVVPTGTTPPATCLPADLACTTHPVPALVVTKTAVPASTTPVNEGQVVTYTLTFDNAAGKAPATVNHTDVLTKVLDDATVTTPPATTSGLTVSPITGGTFTITGAVPPGTTATVTLAVTVNTPDTGDHQLDNFVVPTGATPPTECLPSDLTCTTHPVPALVVTKTAVPASTTPVNEGQVVTYTLTFDNAAGKAPATVNHTDDLTKVLDDATVTTPPALATGTGLIIGPITGGTFTITGAVPPGTTATVTLAVTVNTPDTGDHQLDNFVVPTGTTPPADVPAVRPDVHHPSRARTRRHQDRSATVDHTGQRRRRRHLHAHLRQRRRQSTRHRQPHRRPHQGARRRHRHHAASHHQRVDHRTDHRRHLHHHRHPRRRLNGPGHVGRHREHPRHR